jgi:hypothetical protein
MKNSTLKLIRKEAIRWFETGEAEGDSIESVFEESLANYEKMTVQKQFECRQEMKRLNGESLIV